MHSKFLCRYFPNFRTPQKTMILPNITDIHIINFKWFFSLLLASLKTCSSSFPGWTCLPTLLYSANFWPAPDTLTKIFWTWTFKTFSTLTDLGRLLNPYIFLTISTFYVWQFHIMSVMPSSFAHYITLTLFWMCLYHLTQQVQILIIIIFSKPSLI